MKRVPVFLINGFLDSGKTQFILSTIRRDEYYTRGKTLLIVCEQGDNEYDLEELKRYRVDVVYFDDITSFNVDSLSEAYKKYKPNRIVIEFNFLWDISKINLPDFYDISQIITLVDGETFPVYYNNMRQSFNDAFKYSDVVAFTKLNDDRTTLAPFETGLKLINSQCLYCLINEECISTMEAFENTLPYDINSSEITIMDQDFGIFYIDTFKNRKDYEGKIITFNAWVVRSNKLEKNEFIAGRKVLACCANDVQLYGYLVRSSLSIEPKDNEWIKITAKCHIEYNEQYQEEELVLYPSNIEIIKEIQNPILDLR